MMCSFKLPTTRPQTRTPTNDIPVFLTLFLTHIRRFEISDFLLLGMWNAMIDN
jgi:hypothetical protein